MTDQNFQTSFIVPQSPAAVFDAITNVRGWWSEDVQGATDVVGSVFDYAYRDVHRAQIRVTELVPGQRVAWHVVKNHFNFTQDQTEWTGTDIVFDITPVQGGTQLRFTHIGLVPEYECFDVCSNGWGTYIGGSLRALITTGTGMPNKGEPMNASEKALSA
jgi:uncharacterized protein YndB with AHSA1/START domain